MYVIDCTRFSFIVKIHLKSSQGLQEASFFFPVANLSESKINQVMYLIHPIFLTKKKPKLSIFIQLCPCFLKKLSSKVNSATEPHKHFQSYRVIKPWQGSRKTWHQYTRRSFFAVNFSNTPLFML